MKNMKFLMQVLVLTVMTFLTFGCTGTKVTVTPDPSMIQTAVVVKKCGAVAVKETTSDHVYPPAGNMVPGFAKDLENSGLFDTVYYPSRSDDKVEVTVDAKFDVIFNPNMGPNLVKSFITGLFLFLPEPLLWYDYDYNLNGKVDVYAGKTIAKTVEAQTTGEVKLKFLSLSEAVNKESETLAKSKSSINKQLINKLADYCGSR